MIQDGEYVKVMVYESGDMGRSKQVGAIRLDRGQVVKEMPGTSEGSV